MYTTHISHAILTMYIIRMLWFNALAKHQHGGNARPFIDIVHMIHDTRLTPRPCCRLPCGKNIGVRTMRKLSHDDQATRSITPNADANNIVCIHTVKPDSESPTRYELKWTFNFADVTHAELLALAGRTVLITQQANWRKLPTDKERLDADKVDNVTYRVRDMLDQKRTAADPKTKITRAAAKMSKAERAEMIAALEAMDTEDE